MRFNEFAPTATPTKPKTPDQTHLDALKHQKERVTDAIKAERDRQKIAKAQKQIAQIKLSSI